MLNSFKLLLIFSLTIHAALMAQESEQADSTVYTLGFSTYLAHSDMYTSGFDIYTDDEGHTYICGNTRDKNFPATEGAYQTELRGEADAFVVKFSPEGEILFATLLGGTKREHHSGITVDNEGYIYIAGGTHSSDFPVTEGSYDTSFNGEAGWGGDVFLTKLNPTGTEIVFSTFIGGELQETCGTEDVRIDSRGNIVVVGTTHSHDFPLTHGTIEKDNKNGHGFISKFSPDGKNLLFSTFIGNSIMDGVASITFDDKDNIYLVGGTFSSDLPVTDNALRKEIIYPTGAGQIDHYIAKISATDHKISYLSYFAGKGFSIATIKWIKPNKLLVGTSAMEEGMLHTDNVLCNKGDSVWNCYISIFNSETMELEYSAVFGGSDIDKIMNAHFLNDDTIVIGGMTNSSDFPLTEKALYTDYPVCEKTFNNSFLGLRKSFISVIDIKNSKLLYSSYLGSCHLFYIYPDKNGNISFVAEAGQKAQAGATGFPVTENAFMEPPSYAMVGRLLLNAPPEPKKEIVYEAVHVDDAILESYVGKYELIPGLVFTITKHDSQLNMAVTGQGEALIIPIAQNKFGVKGIDAQLTFNKNDAGKVVSLTLHQHGANNDAKRIED